MYSAATDVFSRAVTDASHLKLGVVQELAGKGNPIVVRNTLDAQHRRIRAVEVAIAVGARSGACVRV